MVKIDVNPIYNIDYNEQNKNLKDKALSAQHTVLKSLGIGHEFLGWRDLISNYDKTEFNRIKETAKEIRSNSQIVIVIGVGGSYLGAKAVIHALKGECYNEFCEDGPKIYFSGNNLCGDSYPQLLSLIKNNDTSLIVISKSGTTLEPALSFRILRDAMERKYGNQANERIYAITDIEKGALKALANKKGYETFVVPDDIGGRYSVFTAVGLLPIAVAGIDIDKLYEGLASATEEYKGTDIDKNPCLQYAMARNMLYDNGSKMEILISYNPRLRYIAEWWKQLFGESEGKAGKGLFPVSVSFTTDLHSLGQMLQDGNKIFFETTLNIEESTSEVIIPYDENNSDGLNYIAGKTLSYVNKKAYEGTVKAHTAGGVHNLEISMSELDEYNLAKLLYFFMMSCAISSYMLDVNPFDQPGVEMYKKNMYKLLGKE